MHEAVADRGMTLEGHDHHPEVGRARRLFDEAQRGRRHRVGGSSSSKEQQRRQLVPNGVADAGEEIVCVKFFPFLSTRGGGFLFDPMRFSRPQNLSESLMLCRVSELFRWAFLGSQGTEPRD